MSPLLLKLVLTPTLIGLASLAGRKWGHAVSGWIVALPVTSGPIVFLLALTHGQSFAAQAAGGVLEGGFSVAAFCIIYGRLAPRWTWLSTLTAATVGFLLMTALLREFTVPLVPLWAAVLASFVMAIWLLPGNVPDAASPAQLPGRWDIPLRMLIATVFVFLITGLAPLVGPHLAGLLSPYPLFTATLAVFAQHQHGGAAAIKVLRGLLIGMFSYASFMLTLGLLLEPAGVAAAFGAAVVVVIVFQSAALWLLRQRIG